MLLSKNILIFALRYTITVYLEYLLNVCLNNNNIVKIAFKIYNNLIKTTNYKNEKLYTSF